MLLLINWLLLLLLLKSFFARGYICPFDQKGSFDSRFWNGWWDQPQEGTFTNVNTGEALDGFQPWYLGEPNGKNMENCGIVWVTKNMWNDQGCEFKMCGFCELEKAPDIVIRGPFFQ